MAASSNPTMLPSPPSQMEAEFYYAGLPSRPKLVARTGAPWEAPTDPEAYPVAKELRPAGKHALHALWDDNIAPRVVGLLDEWEIKWTSLDVVRIGIAGEYFAPVVLWIGVLPGSLSGARGVFMATRCRTLLEENGITDVDVEIRESVVERWATMNT